MSQPVLITTRDLIRGVADTWKAQYQRSGDWSDTFAGSSRGVWERLSALDVETATAEDVAAIIGNNTWTSLSCDQCKLKVDAVVELGEAPDYESRTTHICSPCLRLATKLLRGRCPMREAGNE